MFSYFRTPVLWKFQFMISLQNSALGEFLGATPSLALKLREISLPKYVESVRANTGRSGDNDSSVISCLVSIDQLYSFAETVVISAFCVDGIGVIVGFEDGEKVVIVRVDFHSNPLVKDEAFGSFADDRYVDAILGNDNVAVFLVHESRVQVFSVLVDV